MSGFAAVYERSNTPIEPGVLERMLQRLSHRGVDGLNRHVEQRMVMGCWHFWVTPEENGETQPVRIIRQPWLLLFDGRLDNRQELARLFNLNEAESSQISDAQLFLLAYARRSVDCFTALVGEFAAVLYDSALHELICVRDPLGDRSLFYGQNGTQVVVASEPYAVLEGLGITAQLDERAAAHHFAFQIPQDGQTFFKGVLEVKPAQWVRFADTGRVVCQTYWQPEARKHHPKRSDQDYVEEFRVLLEESIRCRMRSTTAVGVMMSGGLDSTSIACLAARMMAPQPLKTVSYVFDRFADCDERLYMHTVRDRYNTLSVEVVCDDQVPYQNPHAAQINPNAPSSNPYRPILEKTYDQINREGLRVVLTGMYGDNLYLGGVDCLADAFFARRLGQTWREAAYLIRHFGWKRTLRSRMMRGIGKRLILQLFGDGVFRRSYTPPPWLTDEAAALVKVTMHAPSQDRRMDLLSELLAVGNSSEFFHTNRHGFEMRTPFRDRRLVEYAISLPAYLHYSQGVDKLILRLALKDVLPEAILNRDGGTNLISFLKYGMEQELPVLQNALGSDDAPWIRYVRAHIVQQSLDADRRLHRDNPEGLLVPLCFFFDLWYKSSIVCQPS